MDVLTDNLYEKNSKPIRNDQPSSSQTEDDNDHRQLFCSDTLFESKDENGASSMDLTETGATDSSLEIGETRTEIDHLYDELMKDNGSNDTDNSGSFVNFVNDEAAESAP